MFEATLIDDAIEQRTTWQRGTEGSSKVRITNGTTGRVQVDVVERVYPGIWDPFASWDRAVYKSYVCKSTPARERTAQSTSVAAGQTTVLEVAGNVVVLTFQEVTGNSHYSVELQPYFDRGFTLLPRHFAGSENHC